MTNLMKAIILNVVMVVLLAGGFLYINNVEAESAKPELISFVELDLNTFPDVGIEIAQNSCGTETCTASQCCCLNTETGAQCCRTDVDKNCVSSCQKSDPC
ncbi:MAG: hypothetical protein AAF462_07275 [Thermodesulfobacteriota bacterium]